MAWQSTQSLTVHIGLDSPHRAWQSKQCLTLHTGLDSPHRAWQSTQSLTVHTELDSPNRAWRPHRDWQSTQGLTVHTGLDSPHRAWQFINEYISIDIIISICTIIENSIALPTCGHILFPLHFCKWCSHYARDCLATSLMFVLFIQLINDIAIYFGKSIFVWFINTEWVMKEIFS